jgi:hypothetical protein
MTQRQRQLQLAAEEADLIGDLTGRRKLRVHVVGDASSPEAASLLAAAMLKHEQKRGRPAWTYTHAWRRVPVASWLGARVLASCEKISDAVKAIAAGYPVALIVPPLTNNKAFKVDRDERGKFIEPLEVVPCPAQFKRNGRRLSVCETCSICQNTDRLKRDRRVVGFQPDYQSEKKIIPLLKA